MTRILIVLLMLSLTLPVFADPLKPGAGVKVQPARATWNTGYFQEALVRAGLKELGYQVLAISPDRPEVLAEGSEGKSVLYSLISDSKMDAARAFGLAWRVDDEMYKKFVKYGIDLEKSSGQTHHELPVPAVFVLDKKGRIQFSYVNPDYRIRLEPEILLAAIEAFR